MTGKLDLVAIKKNNMFYVRDKDKYPKTFPDARDLIFDVDRLTSYNSLWVVFDTLPSSAERRVSGGRTLTAFRLRDGFAPSDRTPAILPPTVFACDDDGCENTDIRGLYDGECDEHPDTWESVDLNIELIDEDCEPLFSPKYGEFKTDFPHYVDKHTVVRHKYPCHIDGDRAFKYIVDAVKASLPDHCFVSSDYKFSFAVKLRAPVLHEETIRVDNRRFNARKAKWVDVPLREITVDVINICTAGHDYGEVIRAVSADNYYELEAKMDMIIQGYLDLLKPKPVVCQHCKGHGWMVGDEP
jgi:hypothetical protein